MISAKALFDALIYVFFCARAGRHAVSAANIEGRCEKLTLTQVRELQAYLWLKDKNRVESRIRRT
jgi:hypothetical protein